MALTDLKSCHKQFLGEYLRLFSGCRLSAYAVENIYIWTGIYRVRWKIIEECLCVFFEDNQGCFLYLPPLGASKRKQSEALERCFAYMRGRNKAALGMSRIENVPQELLFLSGDDHPARPSMREYLCSRESLISLRGNGFKSKRSCCNYFAKNYKYEYKPFQPALRREIETLYDLWSGQRRQGRDKVYDGMIGDSRVALRKVLEAADELDYRGGALFVGGELKGFTLGYAVNKDTFCVLYEFTDLSCRGAAQFIFREFCRSLRGYAFINVMDDSGLENLSRVKMSYRPREALQAYSIFTRE